MNAVNYNFLNLVSERPAVGMASAVWGDFSLTGSNILLSSLHFVTLAKQI